MTNKWDTKHHKREHKQQQEKSSVAVSMHNNNTDDKTHIDRLLSERIREIAERNLLVIAYWEAFAFQMRRRDKTLQQHVNVERARVGGA